MILRSLIAFAMLITFVKLPLQALERPDVEFEIFQFLANRIFFMGGNTED